MSNDRLKYLLNERRAILEEQQIIKSALDEVNSELLDLLADSDGETIDGETVKVIRPSNKMEYDWDKLRAKVSDEQWKRITMNVPSKELLESAVSDGVIELSTVSDSTITIPGTRPYIKVTRKK